LAADKAQINISKGAERYVAFNVFLHIYLMMTLQRSFSLGPGAMLRVLPFLVVGSVFPVFVHLQIKRRPSSAVLGWGAWASFLWLGALALFLSFGLFVDVFGVFLGASRVVAGSIDMAATNRPLVFFVNAAVSIAASAYGVFEAKRIRIKRLVVRTKKDLGPSGKVRVVQMSDAHFGILVNRKRAMDIADAIKVANPDVLVSTGDFIDANVSHTAGIDVVFRGITPRYGKYAILGNHEVSAGVDESVALLKSAGFSVLRNEDVRLEVPVMLRGVDDEAVVGGPPVPSSPVQGLGGFFSVLLRHRPIVDVSGPLSGPDLQLSGHTHAGQILPFRKLSSFFFPMSCGRHDLPGGTVLYVSHGIGTWGPPMRFLSPPEIVVVDLENTRVVSSARQKRRKRPRCVSIREAA